ncbi:MAG TPA: phosphatase PAP2 family protein [Solirubrobacterales bacterium]|nr:phosphatase PAP2 family protein [Solirubrobacterales bacterium]
MSPRILAAMRMRKSKQRTRRPSWAPPWSVAARRPQSIVKRRRNPVLAAFADADQAALRFLRTHGHHEPVETVMKALGTCGELAAIWVATGAVGASIDDKRRRQWLTAGAVGPVAIGVNYAIKVAVGRQRPLLDEHPPLARAPTKLSFPSTHATSSVAAATALGRVEPRARPALFTVAAAICVGRPYLGMHYPSDVLAGAAVGFALGSVVPGLGAEPTEDRLFELAVDANERAHASRQAPGNGGAVAATADEPTEPSSETA